LCAGCSFQGLIEKLRADRVLIFTIGQGSRRVVDLVAALRTREVRYLCDVRSVPMSKHAPEFCGVELSAALSLEGVTYIGLGGPLGGRPQDRGAYNDDGYVNYDKLIVLPAFQAGIDRLVKGAAGGHRIAVFCSEGQPERCHRSKAIGRALCDRGVDVLHIDAEDCDITQDAVMQRFGSLQLSLLGEAEDPSVISRGRYL
jgi:uncharacterized protein (DUF488 family)